jgi:hypothetical protein
MIYVPIFMTIPDNATWLDVSVGFGGGILLALVIIGVMLLLEKYT